ncbi:MAG TPA: hypothetical protein PLN69_00815 [bacterium]|nr:hypothetical protein [bacterium]
MKAKRSKQIVLFIAVLMLIVMSHGCGGGGSIVGDRGGDNEVPVISMNNPSPQSSISDVEFRAETFYIEFDIYDTSTLVESSKQISFKMDDGTAVDVTDRFTMTDSNTIKSNGDFYTYTRTLFDLATNDQTRHITVSVSIMDYAENEGGFTGSFNVYPTDMPAPPPPLDVPE